MGADWTDSVAHPKIPPVWVTNAADVAAPAVPVAAGAAGKPAAAPRAARTVSHKLLRVFDYSVQPNGRYRYRVKLELQNPNFGLNAKFLKNPAAPLNSQEFRTSEKWSDPTDVVVDSQRLRSAGRRRGTEAHRAGREPVADGPESARRHSGFDEDTARIAAAWPTRKNPKSWPPTLATKR